jgi:hypothetical protein
MSLPNGRGGENSAEITKHAPTSIPLIPTRFICRQAFESTTRPIGIDKQYRSQRKSVTKINQPQLTCLYGETLPVARGELTPVRTRSVTVGGGRSRALSF